MSEELSAFAKKRKAKKRLRFFLIALLLLAVFGTATYLLLENYFVVGKVSVQKSTIYETGAISEAASIKKGTPLYRLDRKKICSAIEDSFPYLEDVTVRFKLPDGVKITYREEFGEFSLKLGVELFAVDRSLHVLAKEDTKQDIPRTEILCGDVKSCIVGEKLTFIDEGTAPILEELIEELITRKLLEKIRAIDVSDKFDITIAYDDRFEVILGDREDLVLKLSMMEEVIADLGADAKGRIDLVDANNAYVKLSDSES